MLSRVVERALLSICSLSLMGASLLGCADSENPYNIGKKAYILSLNIEGYLGVIDVQSREIKVYIADSEYDITSVEPQIEIPEGADYVPRGRVDFSEPVDYTVSFGTPESEVTYKVSVQVGEAVSVHLDANRVFFSPCGRLANHLKTGGEQGDVFNGGKFFDYTYGWKETSDTLVWGIDLKQAGKLEVKPVLGVPEEQNESEVEILLGSQSRTIRLSSTGGYTDFDEQEKVVFEVDEPGRYILKMKIKSSKDPDKDVAYVHKMLVGGKASIQAEPVCLRWRPAAIHAGWSNSSKPANIVTAIHEVTIKSDRYSVYCPITSNFGYFGSTWNAADECFGGINFSLWTHGAGEAPPPVERFSHLIAVGNGMRIDGFNHEGTGVKPKGVNPYLSMKGERTQALALKKIPGRPYDVFYGYYWDTNKKEWALFGCGKKYNGGNLTYLSTGAFVEVPGAPERQRSGHMRRDVAHRGWYLDAENNIYPINRMSHAAYDDEGTYRNWSVTQDGKFMMSMGGFDTIVKPGEGILKIDSAAENPEYLSLEKLSVLQHLPVQIKMLEPTEISSNSAVIHYRVNRFGTNPVVMLYWGKSDGLTFTEGNVGNGGVVKWDHKARIQPSGLSLSYEISGLDSSSQYYYRLQIVNDEGEIWAWDSGRLTTKDGSGPPVPKEDLTANLTFKAVSGHKMQEGNVIHFENPYGNTMKIDIVVDNIPAGYTLKDFGDLRRTGSAPGRIEAGGQVVNMHISLDGGAVELLSPSAKGFGNFVAMKMDRVNQTEGNIHSRMTFNWQISSLPRDKAAHLFADSYVGYGGFLQYQFDLELWDNEGVQVKEKSGNPAIATVVIKNLNVNKNAKVVNLPEKTVRLSAMPPDGMIESGYDVGTIWKEEFGSDIPATAAWQIQYYLKTNLGFFAKIMKGGEVSYGFLDSTKGKVVRNGNRVNMQIAPDLAAGNYAFRFVVKDPVGDRQTWKYIIFNCPVKVVE